MRNFNLSYTHSHHTSTAVTVNSKGALLATERENMSGVPPNTVLREPTLFHLFGNFQETPICKGYSHLTLFRPLSVWIAFSLGGKWFVENDQWWSFNITGAWSDDANSWGKQRTEQNILKAEEFLRCLWGSLENSDIVPGIYKVRYMYRAVHMSRSMCMTRATCVTGKNYEALTSGWLWDVVQAESEG